MKLNKLISKGLALGIILNSISVISYANAEIPNRYQTLEGEYITIDDSMEGNLEEIEIFGNTIQDENNLEDIQSVGDLYVDKDGRPILDKQGRKQYKIEIKSSNSNLLNPNLKMINGVLHPDTGIICSPSPNDRVTEEYIKIRKDNIKYSIFIDTDISLTWFRIFAFDENYNFLSVPLALLNNTHSAVFTMPIGTKYIKLQHLNGDSITINDVTLIEGDISLNSSITYESSKVTILLPTQLQKAGIVKDKLYWDNIKGKYIIEKNIKEYKFLGTEVASIINLWSATNSTPFNVYIPDVLKYNKTGNPAWGFQVFINGFNSKLNGDLYSNDDNIYRCGFATTEFGTRQSIRVRIPGNVTTNNCKNFLKDRTLIYIPEINELIETNITSKLKIPTYNEKTYIYVDSENGINPDLKVTIDKLPQIAKEAVAQAEVDNTNYNIALARMYINMLPESSYKDQLQEQLSEIFSSDMVLDIKTVTSNLDVYIKSENILQMSLDTNQISFNDFSGIEDMEKLNAVNITINSSLPYQLNAYLPMEIQNSDKSATLDKSILNIKENSESAYQTFVNTTDNIILKDNCSAGNQLTHGVDLKLSGGIAHEKDVYKATIKLEVEQK